MKYLAILLAALVTLAPISTSAGVVKTTTGSTNISVSVASGSFSVDALGGTSCFLNFGKYGGTGVTALTWGGANMTLATTTSGGFKTSIYYIQNLTAGAKTVAFTWTGADEAQFGWLCTTGEAASSPIGNIAYAASTTALNNFGFTFITSTNNSLIFAGVFVNGDASTGYTALGTGVTSAFTIKNADVESLDGLYQTTTTAGSYSSAMQWTSAAANNPTGAIIEILPAVAAPTTYPFYWNWDF